MKKISQGKLELRATKAQAIDRFMQMRGDCREKINGDSSIRFYCSKKGRIAITNPPATHIENTNSTNLYADITEQDGKTYLAYYTAYSRGNNILKIVFIIMSIVLMIPAIVLAVADADTTVSPLLLILCLPVLAFMLWESVREKKNSADDSATLIKELQNRAEAVDLWDK